MSLSVRVKRIDPVTGEVKEYESLAQTTEEGFTTKSIKSSIANGKRYKGYVWEEVERTPNTFSNWMVRWVREKYTGKESIPVLAKQLGLNEDQIRRKVDYLGLNRSKEQKDLDYKTLDYQRMKEKVEKNKERIHKGGKVIVKYYGEDASENFNKTLRKLEVVVDGAYEHFFNVLINGRRVGYTYQEVVKVID